MHFTQLNTQLPQELLAWDEGFLDAAESGAVGEVLWFWESPQPFVVVGYGQSIPVEVHQPNAQQDHVPILRRCSGGGAVVQGPGCLNYGLVLPITDESGPTGTITATNHWVMERNRRALQTLLPQTVAIRGHTDLAIVSETGTLKFSGNAQRRRRTFLLFHGTILIDFHLPLIERYLRFPSKVPEYRESRSHLEFVANTGLARSAVMTALKAEWGANRALERLPQGTMEAALDARYSRAEFHTKL
jgi:lipoate-protein ligase A